MKIDLILRSLTANLAAITGKAEGVGNRQRPLSPLRATISAPGNSRPTSVLRPRGEEHPRCPPRSHQDRRVFHQREARWISVTRPIPERVYANVFRVSVPPAVIICDLEQELGDERLIQLRRTWAFAVVSPTKLLSFEFPPTEVELIPKRRLPEISWADCPIIEGKPSLDVVKELIWRSLNVACFRVGFVWCDNRKVLHFPFSDRPQQNISLRHLDGRNTRVGVTGERSRGQGAKATTIRYQLGPRFSIGQDEAKVWWATMRIYVRTTDCSGKPLEGKAIGRSRKAVTKSWWNKQWLARTLGIMQAISNGAEEITIGAGSRTLAVSTAPLEWECPVSIDVDAVNRIGDFQEEMAALRYVEDDDDADEHGEHICESETKPNE